MCGILCRINDATTIDAGAGPAANRDTVRSETVWLLGVAAGAVPVVAVVALDPGGWFPFGVAKWWGTVGVVVVAVACGVATGRAAPAAPVRSERFANVFVGALIGLVVVTAPWALDGSRAWIGTPIRHLGVLAWVLFGVSYLVGRRVATVDALATTLNGCVVAALALGGYGLVERFFGRRVDYLADTYRLGGSYGSASYVAALCCLLGPVAIGVAAESSTARNWRIASGLSAMSVLMALIGSGSRAGALGALVGGTVVIVARPLRWRRVERAPRFWSIVPTIFVISTAAAAVFGSASNRSALSTWRVDEWRIVWHALDDRPITGVGLNGYLPVVGSHLDALYGETVGIDRVHNGVLEVAVSSGLVTAVVYLLALAMIWWCAIRLIRRGRRIDVGVAAAVVAYSAQQQFLFPIAEIDPTFWLLSGIVAVRSSQIGSP